MSDGCADRAKRLVPFLQAKDVRKVLQVGGCEGLSAAVFIEGGFEVTVIDASPEATRKIQQALDKKGQSARLVTSDVLDSGLETGEFDFIFAYNSIYDQPGSRMVRTVDKLLSALREGGFFYITFISTRLVDCGKGEEVEPGSFRWGHQTIHYSTAAEVVTLFKRTETIDLRDQEQETEGSFHWHMMGRNRDLTPPAAE